MYEFNIDTSLVEKIKNLTSRLWIGGRKICLNLYLFIYTVTTCRIIEFKKLREMTNVATYNIN